MSDTEKVKLLRMELLKIMGIAITYEDPAVATNEIVSVVRNVITATEKK